MKAIVTTQYGPPEVLELREVPVPAPADDQVLIEVHAASVNPLDGYVMRGPLFFLPIIGSRLKPKHKIMGADIAGRIISAGKDVTQFKPGDEVYGGSFGKNGMGGFAEYVCSLEETIAPRPANLSFEAAAAVPVAAITALQGLRDKGEIKPGQRVLIDGSSGGVGTFAVQIAKAFGAEVTAVCSTSKIDMAASLGADHVIDYTREDFTRSGQRYDLILGANAHHSTFDYMRALSRDGIFVMIGGAMGRILQAMVLAPALSRMGSKKARFFVAKVTRADLDLLTALIQAGKVTPIIDRTYPLSEAADALRYREEGHASGKIILTVRKS